MLSLNASKHSIFKHSNVKFAYNDDEWKQRLATLLLNLIVFDLVLQ